jgi:ribosomal protein S18 acetylase RimI-like enzyme
LSEPSEKIFHLRSAKPGDREFLFRVYASARAMEMERTAWSEEARAAFLRDQYELRRRAYAANFPRAETYVVCRGPRDAGTLAVDRAENEIRIVDMALLPEFRGVGLGRQLLEGLQEEATDTRRPLRLSVLKWNDARRLYERLGFRPARMRGNYVEMEWFPAAQ